MSFFFNDEATLKALVKTVASSLVYDGKFIGTMLDGKRVYDALQSSPNGRIEDLDPKKCYYIKREYPASAPLGIGLKITVNLENTATVEQDQVEWLAPFDLLVAELASQDIILEESLYFDDPNISSIWPKQAVGGEETSAIYKRLTLGEKQLNGMYRYFVFKRKRSKAGEARAKQEKVAARTMQKNALDMLTMDDTEELPLLPPALYPEPLIRVGTIGEGSCFMAGTKVYTTDGPKNIEDVKIGDCVVTREGSIKPVEQLHTNELDDRVVHALKIHKSEQLYVTGNHRFWAINGGNQKKGCKVYSKPTWVAAEDLTNDYLVMMPRRKTDGLAKFTIDVRAVCPEENEYYSFSYETKDDLIRQHSVSKYTVENNWAGEVHIKAAGAYMKSQWVVDEDFCEFLGIWYGDGSSVSRIDDGHRRARGINVVSARENVKLIDYVKVAGEKIFGIAPVVHEAKGQNLVTVSFNGALLGDVFNKMFGKGFDGKRLPSFLFQDER